MEEKKKKKETFPDESLVETGTFPQIVSVLTNQHFPMKNSVKNSQPALILTRLTQGWMPAGSSC